jgi:hypothetical protein
MTNKLKKLGAGVKGAAGPCVLLKCLAEALYYQLSGNPEEKTCI